MAVNAGYTNYILADEELTWGTQGTATTWIGLPLSFTPKDVNNLTEIRMLGGSRNAKDLIAMGFDVAGSFEFQPQTAYIFKYPIGSVVNGTVAPYIHTISEANTLSSLTFEIGNSGGENTTWTYSGCKINKMTVSLKKNEIMTCSMDYVGKTVLKGTSLTSPTAGTALPYSFSDGYITTVASGTVATLNSTDITLDNTLDPRRYVNNTSGRLIGNLVESDRRYSAKVDFDFDSADHYEQFLGAVGSTTPQGTIGSFTTVLKCLRGGNASEYFQWTLSGCKIDSPSMSLSPKDVVTEALDIKFVSSSLVIADDTANPWA